MQIDVSKEPQLQAALNTRVAQELGALMQDRLLLDITADALYVENQQLRQHQAELVAAHEQREAELVAANTRIKEELSSLRQDFDSLRKAHGKQPKMSRETLVGPCDGLNLIFELQHVPIEGSVDLKRNGVSLRQGETHDFTVSDRTVTMTFAPAPADYMSADYRY